MVALLFSEVFPFEPGEDSVVAAAADGPHVLQQVTLLAYRLDFAFEDEAGEVRLVVELDGHNFHDRTPEQAERDRARDPKLLLEGWTTVRYTGRDMVRDRMRRAREALETLRPVGGATRAGVGEDGGAGGGGSDEGQRLRRVRPAARRP